MKFLFLFLLLSLSSVTSLAEMSIKVLSTVGVSSPSRIYLSDLLMSKNLPESLRKKISTLDMGNSPQIGEKRVFSQRALSQILRKTVKKKYPQVKITIPKESYVYSVKKKYSLEKIKAHLKKHWQILCAPCEAKIISLNLPEVSQAISWKINLNEKIPRGSFSEQIVIQTIDKKERVYWVNGQVKIMKEVVSLVRDLPFQQRVQKTDLTLSKKDITFMNKEFAKVENLLGKKLNRSYRLGDVLFKNSVLREHALNRGDVVQVKAGNALWQISLNARAEQNAYVGDTISFKNIRSGKIFSARVTGKGEAIIE